jgi:AhpC/TSA family
LNRGILVTLAAIFCFAVFPIHLTYADGKTLSKGTSLPRISFKDAVSGDTMNYLGLSRKSNFSLDDIHGSLLIIELFSTYCTSCPRNVPILNDVYTRIERDTRMKGKIKILAIAIGNTGKEVESYKAAYNVLFPVLTDLNFSVHDAFGNPRVPYTIFVRKTAKGKTIIDSHQGVLDSTENVLKKVHSLN